MGLVLPLSGAHCRFPWSVSEVALKEGSCAVLDGKAAPLSSVL